MLQRIQSMPKTQRMLLFSALMIAAVLLFIILIGVLIVGSFNSVARTAAAPLVDFVTVGEFATLPDDDAYPAAVAVGRDGVVYTGSYVSGAVWSILATGEVNEIEGTRGQIGSVSGLTIAPDGALLILDRIEALTAQGAVIWRVSAEEALTQVATLPGGELGGGYDDIALDSLGRIYVSDRVRNAVWRIEKGVDSAEIWWQAREEEADPTGLNYDAANDRLLMSDSILNRIYSLSLEGTGSAVEVTILYDHGRRPNAPGFDGLVITSQGEIYYAALNTNQVGRLDGEELTVLAGGFRGASDLDYDPVNRRLIVANWNQFALAFNTQPQLPFALDVITFR